jgi:cob(I)alamin adenosyltransferase
MPSQIYTRQGDAGLTCLGDGTRLPKNAVRVEAYGEVDETNAWISTARSHLAHPADRLLEQSLEFLQHRLYNCSCHLATPLAAAGASRGAPSSAGPSISEADLAYLERTIDAFEEATGPLRVFVLPGGTPGASLLHVARTVCRRAERRVVALGLEEPLDPLVLRFLNRSSDFLFAAARYANTLGKVGDEAWDKNFPIPPAAGG